MLSQLKQARLSAGKEIEEVSNALNIRKQYLIALEEGDFNSIPGRVYVNGYLKLYSKYLGITMNSAEESPVKPKFSPHKIPFGQKFQKYLIALSIIMLIITMLIYQLITSQPVRKDLLSMPENSNVINII